MRALVVEDNEIALELLRNHLTDSGYEVSVARDGREALELVRSGQFPLVISDWEMPQLNGLQLCHEIRKRQSGQYIYIILVTARNCKEDVVEGLRAGADDFISKPFNTAELCLRVRAGERILSLDSRDVTIFSLAKLAESRDPQRGDRLERMREYSGILADHLFDKNKFRGQLNAQYAEMIYQTSPLHDVGKIAIPDSILLKQEQLTDVEYDLLKQHTIIGADTLEAAAKERPYAKYLNVARDIARSHHESFDGTGYPDGLKGEEIPLCARVVALADLYDALTSRCGEKDPCTHEAAIGMIREEKEKQLDPTIVDAFLATEDKFNAVRRKFSDSPDAIAAPEEVSPVSAT